MFNIHQFYVINKSKGFYVCRKCILISIMFVRLAMAVTDIMFVRLAMAVTDIMFVRLDMAVTDMFVRLYLQPGNGGINES